MELVSKKQDFGGEGVSTGQRYTPAKSPIPRVLFPLSVPFRRRDAFVCQERSLVGRSGVTEARPSAPFRCGSIYNPGVQQPSELDTSTVLWR